MAKGAGRKLARSAKRRKKGKGSKAFANTVAKTGRWRGHKVKPGQKVDARPKWRRKRGSA